MVAVCRELTKLHEEVARGSAALLAERFAAGARGEVTLVIEGERGKPEPPDAGAEAGEGFDLEGAVRAELGRGASARDIARALCERTGLPRNQVYRLAVRLKQESRGSES